MTCASDDDEFDQFVISIFRLNRRLLEAGDQLTAPLGITSARWQVLGAIALNENALTIPRIARFMGISRQAAIKQIKLLVEDGFVISQSNHSHKRADLWRLTASGRSKYTGVMAAHRTQSVKWRQGISIEDLQACSGVLKRLESAIETASLPG